VVPSPPVGFVLSLFFLNDPAATEIYTLSHTTLFRSHDRLADRLRRATPGGREVERRQRLAAGPRMHVEQRDPVRPLDQLHRAGVAWVHFDRVGEPSPRHEIDPVYPHQAERPGDALRQEGGPLEQTVVRRKLRISGRAEDAPAVTEPIGSERGLP